MTVSAIDLGFLHSWIGNEETDRDWVSPRVVAQMAGLLGWDKTPKEGDALPLPWYWLFFNPVPHRDRDGVDGHPVKGGFLPAIPYPRRMWASSKVNCLGELRVGDRIEKKTRILNIEEKKGRSGAMVFLTLEHLFSDSQGRPAICEEQTIVYKEAISGQYKPSSALPFNEWEAQWSLPQEIDSLRLFRYSALTFNGHRIHYDRDYAIDEEGYPALVVQGPLMASLMIDSLYQQGQARAITGFHFRGVNPLFDTDRCLILGRIDDSSAKLCSVNSAGQQTMTMSVTLAENGR